MAYHWNVGAFRIRTEHNGGCLSRRQVFQIPFVGDETDLPFVGRLDRSGTGDFGIGVSFNRTANSVGNFPQGQRHLILLSLQAALAPCR